MESRPPGAVIYSPVHPATALPRRWIALLLVFVSCAGCQPVTRDDKISARSDPEFELWISKHDDVLTLADIKELNTARQQLRYKVMQARPGLSSADFAAALYAEIDGRTLNELLQASYALQIDRVKTELANYQTQVERYQKLQENRFLDEQKKQSLTEALNKLGRLTEEHQAELSVLTARLSELNTPAVLK